MKGKGRNVSLFPDPLFADVTLLKPEEVLFNRKSFFSLRRTFFQVARVGSRHFWRERERKTPKRYSNRIFFLLWERLESYVNFEWSCLIICQQSQTLIIFMRLLLRSPVAWLLRDQLVINRTPWLYFCKMSFEVFRLIFPDTQCDNTVPNPKAETNHVPYFEQTQDFLPVWVTKISISPFYLRRRIHSFNSVGDDDKY